MGAATAHSDREFEKDLGQLRHALLTMATGVEEQIASSTRALIERDSALARRVIEGDAEINRRELEIDAQCQRILALRQPAASDLRFITTALKIVTDLERCGDLAVNIAERILDLNEVPALASYRDLPRLAELVQRQLREALESFVNADAERAALVLAGDDGIDDLFLKIFNELLAYMMEDSKNIRRATSLLFVAKHLERIGDHALNVAEMVIYLVRGTDVRHPKSRVTEMLRNRPQK